MRKPTNRSGPCKLYYDSPRDVQPGDYLVTAAGSAYLVQRVRRSPTYRFRKYLDCVRWPAADISVDATVHELRWYCRSGAREQKRRTYPARASSHQ